MNQDLRFSTTLHMLMHLLRADTPVTSQVLAECAATNPVVIRRTMAELRARGVVISTRGRGGGWILAKPAEEVTMRDVYECVAPGNMFSFGFRDVNSGCHLVGAVDTLLGDIQQDMERMYLERLQQVTLADIFATVHYTA